MSGMVEQARFETGNSKLDTGKIQYHTLGLDLAGSLTATGAVGGVLASTTYNSPLPLGEGNGEGVMSQHYLYDGNGNIIAATDSSGAITAKLAYSPFGELLSGSDANLPFTFSTKAVDSSGLSYYGFRFYSPEAGRWLTRDPIEEKGGINQYAYLENQIGNIDLYGLAPLSLGRLLLIEGTLRRVGSNPLIRGSVIGGMILSSADCLLNIVSLTQTPPDCVPDAISQGIWIGECRKTTKNAIASCSQLLGGVIGSIGGPMGNFIGQLVARATSELFNIFASNETIDYIGGCSPGPKIDPCCDR